GPGDTYQFEVPGGMPMEIGGHDAQGRMAVGHLDIGDPGGHPLGEFLTDYRCGPTFHGHLDEVMSIGLTAPNGHKEIAPSNFPGVELDLVDRNMGIPVHSFQAHFVQYVL